MLYLEFEEDEFGYKSKLGFPSEMLAYRTLINKLIRINKNKSENYYLYLKGKEFKSEEEYQNGTPVKYIVFDGSFNIIHFDNSGYHGILELINCYINEKTETISFADDNLFAKILLLHKDVLA